jgi:hypothetical protein
MNDLETHIKDAMNDGDLEPVEGWVDKTPEDDEV